MRVLRVALWSVLILLPFPAYSDFDVWSLNAYHLGYNKRSIDGYRQAKYAYLNANYLCGAQAPVITLVQEVMAQAEAAEICPPPAVYTVHPQSAQNPPWNLRGFNSYREGYALIIQNATATAGHQVVCYFNADQRFTLQPKDFIRPPDIALIRNVATNTKTWVVNFHALFGAIGNRRQEVVRLGNIVAQLKALVAADCSNIAVSRVLVLGDWNLPATDQAIADFFTAAGFTQPQIQPNGADQLTTVNRAGQLASSYDHFVWDAGEMDVTFDQIYTPPEGYLQYFKNTSDHLGVRANVTD
ncbi:hypothetical protein [Pseudomarimonas arenosa]|uniref:Endonuclease/exonuclease/phosphatase domain-containing protein n=1 Tax=Pseudomarimonas arenosa TaxID=2774145 RepID=A0AAW3ZM53_9GAMM|nr:hypothetical protein [Pseudomarimonas arenosa]MBD8525970.1 hypothetical protein [Pseudomarimonas arenosa]